MSNSGSSSSGSGCGGPLGLAALCVLVIVGFVGLALFQAIREALTPEAVKVLFGVFLTVVIFVIVMVINTAENYVNVLAHARTAEQQAMHEERMMDKFRLWLAVLTTSKAIANLGGASAAPPDFAGMDDATIRAWLESRGAPPTMIMGPQNAEAGAGRAAITVE